VREGSIFCITRLLDHSHAWMRSWAKGRILFNSSFCLCVWKRIQIILLFQQKIFSKNRSHLVHDDRVVYVTHSKSHFGYHLSLSGCLMIHFDWDCRNMTHTHRTIHTRTHKMSARKIHWPDKSRGWDRLASKNCWLHERQSMSAKIWYRVSISFPPMYIVQYLSSIQEGDVEKCPSRQQENTKPYWCKYPRVCEGLCN